MVKFSILIKEKKKEKRWNNNCESHNKDDSNEKSCKNNEQQPTQLNIYVFYDSQQIQNYSFTVCPWNVRSNAPLLASQIL